MPSFAFRNDISGDFLLFDMLFWANRFGFTSYRLRVNKLELERVKHRFQSEIGTIHSR